jgi:hypothetical protein
MNLIEIAGAAEQMRSPYLPSKEHVLRHHRLTLFVPSVNGTGEIPVETRQHVLARCREVLCVMCGGATEWDAMGYWVSQTGFISERVTMITAFFTGDREDILSQIVNLCRWMKDILQQERVALEVDSTLYLV